MIVDLQMERRESRGDVFVRFVWDFHRVADRVVGYTL